MNEITITSAMTLQEYYTCQDALRYGKVGPNFFWAFFAVGAVSCALSAALTWGTVASILAGMALAVFIFILILSGRFDAARRRRAYEKYREANISYTFTNDGILGKWRYGQSYISWAAVDRVMEIRAIYLLVLRNSAVCIPKRDIPAHNVGDFIQLLRTYHLLGQ